MSFYDSLRHFADGHALVAMFAVFAALCAWPFRPGGRERVNDAANSIFEDDEMIKNGADHD